tara:strand:- start:12300 stop:12770 length:471 start_codon:yes stop_codon:yes gene_type:complete
VEVQVLSSALRKIKGFSLQQRKPFFRFSGSIFRPMVACTDGESPFGRLLTNEGQGTVARGQPQEKTSVGPKQEDGMHRNAIVVIASCHRTYVSFDGAIRPLSMKFGTRSSLSEDSRGCEAMTSESRRSQSSVTALLVKALLVINIASYSFDLFDAC